MPDEYVKCARASMRRGEELVLQVTNYANDTNQDQRTGYADKKGIIQVQPSFFAN